MKNEFELAFNEISDLRALPRDVVLEALRNALVSAYQSEAGIGKSQRVEAEIDSNGRPKIFVEKEVVEDVQDDRTEVDLETARFYEPEAQLDDMVMVQVERTTKNFGRIAAQKAKQVILSKIRDAERKTLLEEFSEREGDLINGTVQAVNSASITVGLGRAEAVLPRNQQIPGERYKPHDKLRAYILEVKASNRGPQIILSRSHRNMLRRLLELEVPEIYNGQVEIKNIAREAGFRSKVAVAALQDGIDPVGACVGMKGNRIQNIVKELHDEKIDVIEWNPNHEQFIAKALSPARVGGVYLEDDPDTGRTAVVIVPEGELSQAIGKEGQNARLAAKLTGWRIDIKSVPEAVEEVLENLEVTPYKELQPQFSDMIAETQRIMEKRAANRAVMPEEYQLLNRFADVAQRRAMQFREQARKARVEEINAVKRTLPQQAFQMPIELLAIPDAMVEALQPLGSVGEIMLRYLIDEKRIQNLLASQPPESLELLRSALENLVLPEEVVIEATAESEEEAAAELSAESPAAIAADEIVRDAFADAPEVEVPAPGRKPADKYAPRREFPPEPAFVAPDVDDDDDAQNKGGKKGKKKKHNLVFDEKRGGMVVKRERKHRGGRADWSDWDDEE
jgi:N utilization substance protein A